MKKLFGFALILMATIVFATSGAAAACVAVIYDANGTPYFGRGEDYKLAYAEAVQACRADQSSSSQNAFERCAARALKNISYWGSGCRAHNTY